MGVRADAIRNRERLLRAAAEVFAERGVQAPVTAIAERAGLTKMTLYRHFPSKEDLLLAVMVEHYERLAQAAEELEQSLLSPLTAIERYAAGAVDQLAPDRAYFHVALMAGGVTDEIKAAAGRLDAAVGRLLARAQAENAIRQDLTAGDLHSLLVATASALGQRDRYLAFLLDGLAPGGAPVDEPPMRFEDFSAFQSEQARRRSAARPAT